MSTALTTIYRKTAIATAIAFALTTIPNTYAEDEESAVEEVIVTGVARPTTKLESSMSVSALSAEEVTDFAPRSTAEVFRNIPGIQAESSSGDANSNIKVRGVPISAGGSRYLSMQEDGFPMLLVGDAAFATADSFLRFDTTVASVQSIRGGSASTQAANSPGGIVNFISKTGAQNSGSVGLTVGLDYASNRVDFEYGTEVGDGYDYHIGGFYRVGEGPREAVTNLENGGQIKANLGKDFDDGSIRFFAKVQHDKVPTYLPIPARYDGGKNFSEVGVGFADGTLHLDETDYLNRVEEGVEAINLEDGFESRVASFAIVGDYDFSDMLSGKFKHRTASIDGNFSGPFPAEVYDNAAGNPSARIHYFNTRLDSLDNQFTDVSLTASFPTVDVTAGVASNSQDLNTTWGWNTYFRELDGARTAFDQDGSVGGVLYGHPLWGNCCQRNYNFDIDGNAPYLSLSGDAGANFSWDASIRRDSYDVDGAFAEAAVLAPQDINGDGSIGTNEQEVPSIGDSRRANYKVNFNSWSVGGNYALNDNMALFANISEGGSLSSPDRVTGSITAAGTIQNDSAYSLIDQQEIGFKYRGDNASFYVTYFNAETSEAREFEVTTQSFKENTYEASGFEFEGDYELANGFGVKGSLTLTDPEITKTGDGSNVGNKPRRQADYIYNITPYYQADRWNVGLNLVGTDEVFVQDNNDLKFDAYTTANLYFNYDLNERVSFSVNANNLFDAEGFTEGEEGSAAVGDYVRIRPINGRTISGTVRYNF
ncbi:MAG: TonB-dependent receptor [Gammaproteobacteria bacterium]|nr:TonB-dependent receptor [Gammaproteobacteria bacterium]